MTSLSDYPLTRGKRAASRGGRFLRNCAAAAAAVAGLAFLFASEPFGDAIRGDLAAAAQRLQAMPANASAGRVAADLRGAFAGEHATIDPSGFPATVTVTLHALDRASCTAAVRSARRIEGRVVVELEGYGSSADCADLNDMTWRLMP